MEKKELQISPFIVFFLVHSVQIGVGILGFQRLVIESAGNDAWIAAIAAGVSINIIIWLMYLLLNREQKDLVQIHRDLFGEWIGGVFSLFWIIYWLMIGISIFRSYIEIVQVWMFPTINIFSFSIILMIPVYYCVVGGFRTVAGISTLGVIIPIYVYLTFLFPIEYANFRNLLPIWNHSIKDMSIATKDMIFSYLGFSTLLIYYPYIKHPKKSQKWAHLGNVFTMAILLFILIISIAYFSEMQLSKPIWATLTMWKIVEIPLVERFEFIGITSWVLLLLPNVCLAVWASTRGIQRVFHFNPRKALAFIVLIFFCTNIAIQGREQVNIFIEYVSLLGVCLLFIYLPLLTLLSFLITKIRRRKHEKNV